MTSLSHTILKKFRDEFKREYNRVEPYFKRRLLTEDLNLRVEYKEKLTQTYNKYINYIAEVYSSVNFEKQIKLQEAAENAREKLVKSFKALLLSYEFPQNNFQQIEIAKIVENEIELDEQNTIDEAVGGVDTENTVTSPQLSPASSVGSLTSARSEDQTEAQNNSPESNLNSENVQENLQENLQNENEMAQSKADFLKMASSILNYKFNGNPLKLESFVTDVEMIEEIATAENKEFCFKFIKAKLEGKALECITDEKTVIEIIAALKKEIKPESSTIIEGKIMALKLIKYDYTKFTEEAEKLSEAFRRSLVIEGIPRAKAQEMTIKKTAELCRKTSRSDIVKAALTSTKFEHPGEVIAKFVTESDIVRKEERELKNFRAKQSNNPKFSQNKKFDKNKSFHKNGNRDSRSQGNSFQKHKNGKFQNQKNSNGNNQRNFRQNEQTIRLISGNAPNAPIPGTSNQQAQHEQVFHIPFSN